MTVEAGSSSFKEFMILFDKIYEGTKTIGSKKQMDPQTQKSDEIRELSISKFDTEFNLEDAVGVAKITDRTGPKVGEIVDKGVFQIQVEEDYLTRVGMYNVIDKNGVIGLKKLQTIIKLRHQLSESKEYRIFNLIMKCIKPIEIYLQNLIKLILHKQNLEFMMNTRN